MHDQQELRSYGSDINLQYKTENFRSKKLFVNVQKDRSNLRFDPYLPFQNAKIVGDYYIVPVYQGDGK